MPHKLIKDIDEDVWRKFTGFCKIKDVRVGKELDELLKNHIKKKLNKLFENDKE